MDYNWLRQRVAARSPAVFVDPAHYGASYQLAKAIDQIGDRERARQLWEEVLRMAISYNDTQIVAVARQRLRSQGGREALVQTNSRS